MNSNALLAVLVVGMKIFTGGEQALAEDALSREEQILVWMEGDWTFTLGERRGERTMRMVYPDHLVSYDETFSGTDISGEGYIGYSPQGGVFYSFAAHSVPDAYTFMSGALDDAEDVITFTPQDGSHATPYEVIWRKTSEDAFASTLFAVFPDGGREEQWTAFFTRIVKSPE